MKNKLRILLLIFLSFLVLFSFVSCNEEINGADKDNVEQEDQEPQSQEETEVDDANKIVSCQLIPSVEQNIFYINDQNAPLLLKVIFYNKKGEEVQSQAIWTYDFPKGTHVSSDAQTLSVDVNSTQCLDDYTITVKSKNNTKIKANYNFSLISRDKLLNSISYSYMASSDTNLFETEGQNIDVYSIVELKEYDMTNTRILNSSQRMIINDVTDFNPTGYNIIFLNVKDGANFGKLDATVLQGDVEIIKTENNGFLVCMNKDNQQVKIQISAGKKDIRVLTFEVQVSPDTKLAKPIIGTATNAQYDDGKIVEITGDNVSNESFPLENGYKLNIIVTRRAYNSSEDYYLYTDWKTNSETLDISLGTRIHLKHAGEYKIQASISDALSISDEVEKIVIVTPYAENLESLIEVSLLESYEEIYTQNKWDNYENGDNAPRTNNYKVRINSSNAGVVNYTIVSNNSDPISYSHTITGTLNSGEPAFETQIKYAGSYKITAYVSDVHHGYGTLYKDELDDSNSHSRNLSIANSTETDSIEYITVRNVSSAFSITATTDVSPNAKIYFALYKNDDYVMSKALAPGENYEYRYDSYAGYCFKSYIYYPNNKIPSTVRMFSVTGIPFIKAKPNILWSDSAVSQDKRNMRKIRVMNTQNEDGDYRVISYSWDKINWIYPESNLNRAGKLKDFYFYLDQTRINSGGTAILYVKSEPFNEQEQGSTISTASISLTKLEPPKGSYDWSGTFNWRLTVTVWPTVSGAACEVTGFLTKTVTSKTVIYDSWPGTDNTQDYKLMQWKNGYIDSNTINFKVRK